MENVSYQEAEPEVKQRPFVGYIAWLIQRITAVILLVLIPLKIYSGYALVGDLPGGQMITGLHVNVFLDSLLLFAVIFHALYGLRVILIDFGIVKDNRSVFTVLTILGSLLFVASFVVVVT
ncbi:succinate dehydrogenase / fumarate reductase cytochrome b subunit [Salsuginibacillus halophilus]|uniref:Succinate dehydrogenase / fumarate reductase cytochrome b subunit n=1 Tax=Salsuginibacillus halophilus TaxID=517424 RepID=A0A2P8HL00_9BACI|nr:hypothetical protein [Salsuginibacillus halophilus]PSL46898.1 succinate dehydrogenase / fumarate reductase cytochrome b subunit [Salsuginibacillus halophilus]